MNAHAKDDTTYENNGKIFLDYTPQQWQSWKHEIGRISKQNTKIHARIERVTIESVEDMWIYFRQHDKLAIKKCGDLNMSYRPPKCAGYKKIRTIFQKYIMLDDTKIVWLIFLGPRDQSYWFRQIEPNDHTICGDFISFSLVSACLADELRTRLKCFDAVDKMIVSFYTVPPHSDNINI